MLPSVEWYLGSIYPPLETQLTAGGSLNQNSTDLEIIETHETNRDAREENVPSRRTSLLFPEEDETHETNRD